MTGLRELQKIALCGKIGADRRAALVSITVQGYDPGEVSRVLYENHGIITRSGLHCSPLAHKTAGTYPDGAVRFSFGRGTTETEIDEILDALSRL
jgi:selenocysteine lyase/cysteine desulfurase